MIKFWRQGAALLLAGVMAASLAACGSTSTGSTGNSDNAGASNEGASAENTGGSENNGEIVKLVVWGVGSADTEDCNEVAAAISEITREKIGVEIELVRGQDAEQINLALTSGEPIDMLNYNNVNGSWLLLYVTTMLQLWTIWLKNTDRALLKLSILLTWTPAVSAVHCMHFPT